MTLMKMENSTCVDHRLAVVWENADLVAGVVSLPHSAHSASLGVSSELSTFASCILFFLSDSSSLSLSLSLPRSLFDPLSRLSPSSPADSLSLSLSLSKINANT